MGSRTVSTSKCSDFVAPYLSHDSKLLQPTGDGSTDSTTPYRSQPIGAASTDYARMGRFGFTEVRVNIGREFTRTRRRDSKGSGVWVNDDNTETGWKPLQIRKNWSSFTYTGGYVYKFAKKRMLDLSRKEVITRYAGIC
ncbi:hypothetical protein PM082_011852 [Marasmius tenuissimus]|nr:hypothetical protein PM082_011852 [Marasmius tenuissimus]